MRLLMLNNEYCRSRICKFLTTSCLVLFAAIAIWAGSTSWVMAQRLSPASGIAGESNQELSLPISCVKETKETQEFDFEPKSGILAEINQTFHKDYNQLINGICHTFGDDEGPTVLLLTSKNLILYHNGKREEHEYIPPIYHEEKAIDHHPLALYLNLKDKEGKELTDSLRGFLTERLSLLTKAQKAQNFLVEPKDDVVANQQCEEKDSTKNVVVNRKCLLKDSIDYIEQVLNEGPIDGDKLKTYVSKISPRIVGLINSAAAEQLQFLNGQIKNLIANNKSPDYVVISAVHQARHGEVVTQYFEHVFNEFQGDAAEREDRIVYAESIFDETAALRLLAAHILDRKIGSAFFRNPRRLQRDALMDAASFWLWQHTMEIPKLP